MVNAQSQSEISDHTRQLVIDDLAATEAALISGETLGVQVYPVAGIELDYMLEQTRPAQAWYERDKLDAAEDWGTARQFGTIPRLIRYRRNKLLTRVPELIRADLGAIEPEDEEQAARKEHWLSQVDELTVPELVSYLVYRDLSKPTLSSQDKNARKPSDLTDEDPHESVTYRFGQDELQSGWYDNPECFEIRTNQAGLAMSALRKQRIIRALYKYAKYYGLHLKIPNSQVNVSYQTVEDGELTPVHDASSYEGLEITRRTTDGTLDTVSTVMPSVGQVHNREEEVSDPHRYDAGPDRFHGLRVLPDRFELRYGLGEQDFTEFTELALVAGFIAGVSGTTEGSFNTRIVERTWVEPGPDYEKQRDVELLRVLQSSHFDADGYVQVPEKYMYKQRALALAKFITGVEETDEMFDIWAEFSKPVKQLLNTIRVDEGGRLVCAADRFGEWVLDATTKGDLGLQTLVKDAGEQFNAASITDMLSRFTTTEIRTIETDTQEITTEKLTWHDLVRKLVGSRALRTCVSDETMRQLEADMRLAVTEEAMLTAHFTSMLTDNIKLFPMMVLPEIPSEADYDRYIEGVVGWTIPEIDKICAGRPVDRAQIYQGIIAYIDANTKLSKRDLRERKNNTIQYAYTIRPKQLALARVKDIIESRIEEPVAA